MEKTTFLELEEIKSFIGKDWKDWDVVAETITVTKFVDHWWDKPYTKPLFHQPGVAYLKSEDNNKCLISAEASLLKSQSLKQLMEQ